MLCRYYNHLLANPHSLLNRFCGLYKLECEAQEYWFVAMNNVTPLSHTHMHTVTLTLTQLSVSLASNVKLVNMVSLLSVCIL